jgi:hypothetical protein
VPYAAADSSGFDAHHASRYFIWRRDSQKADKKRPKKQVSYKRYGKLMVIVSCISHAILAAVVSHGPTPDIDQLDSVVAEIPASMNIRHMVLDAGFDSAHNHKLLREDRGILSTIPPEHGRPPKDPNALPSNKYRRMMKQRFRHGRPKVYRKRAQIETAFSMMKRNLGAALRARTAHGRHRDMLLRVLTHNIALALLWVFYRASSDPCYVGCQALIVININTSEVPSGFRSTPGPIPLGADRPGVDLQRPACQRFSRSRDALPAIRT